MKILIVSRTVEGELLCIGGVLEDGRQVRLLNRDGKFWGADIHLQIGEVWRVQGETSPSVTPPYTEDVHVSRIVGRVGHHANFIPRYADGFEPLGGAPQGESADPGERAASGQEQQYRYPPPDPYLADPRSSREVREPAGSYGARAPDSSAVLPPWREASSGGPQAPKARERGRGSRGLLLFVAAAACVTLVVVAWRWSPAGPAHGAAPSLAVGRSDSPPRSTAAREAEAPPPAESPSPRSAAPQPSRVAIELEAFPPRPEPEPVLPPAPPPAPQPRARQQAKASERGSTCENPLGWEEARGQMGEERAVVGILRAVTEPRNVRGNPVWLDIGGKYPEPARLAVVIWEDYKSKFPLVDATRHVGRSVCVAGKIGSFRGVPQITLRSPEQLQLLY